MIGDLSEMDVPKKKKGSVSKKWDGDGDYYLSFRTSSLKERRLPLVDEGLAGASFVGSCLPVPLPLLLFGELEPAFPDWVPLLAGLFAAEVEVAALPS
jgi:hypothetical protein